MSQLRDRVGEEMNKPKKGASRRWAARLKELGEQAPPSSLLQVLNVPKPLKTQEELDHEAFLQYHHKSKILPETYTSRDVLEWYYLAGLRRGRGGE